MVFVTLLFTGGEYCHEYTDFSWESDCDCDCRNRWGSLRGIEWRYVDNPVEWSWLGLKGQTDVDNPVYSGTVDPQKIAGGDFSDIKDVLPGDYANIVSTAEDIYNDFVKPIIDVIRARSKENDK